MTPYEFADKMARHIIGESLCPEGECCRKCIAMAEQYRAAALEEAANLAMQEAYDLEKASYSAGTLPENFADINKWKYIAAAIRALAQTSGRKE